MTTTICKRFFVSGKVQGVFFRSNACKEARKLTIMGWVRNLKDGRVELLACGDPQNLETLEKWLRQGPSGAKVESVVAEKNELEEHSGFVILCSDLF